jgi:Tetratricopeptide repeat
MALVAAGFVAGRGPLERAEPQIVAARGSRSPGRLIAAGATLLVALVSAWTVWQPVSADRAVGESYRLLDEGDPRGALAEAENAHDRNPFAKDPLYAKADALAALDRPADALRTFRDVALDHPRDPDPWVRIASFQLNALDLPREALDSVAIGFDRDNHSQTLAQIRDEATARLAGSTSP